MIIESAVIAVVAATAVYGLYKSIKAGTPAAIYDDAAKEVNLLDTEATTDVSAVETDVNSIGTFL